MPVQICEKKWYLTKLAATGAIFQGLMPQESILAFKIEVSLVMGGSVSYSVPAWFLLGASSAPCWGGEGGGHRRMNYKDTKPYMSAFLSVDLLTDFVAFSLTDFID